MWLIGIGCPGIAGGGLLVFLQVLASGYKATTFFSAVDTILCCLLGLFSFYQMKQAYHVWRAGGGTVQGMKAGIAKDALANAV
jgi:hypothetical protein